MKFNLIFRIGLLSLALVTSPGCTKEHTTTITGIITDVRTGKPLQGVRVLLRIFSGYEHDSVMWHYVGSVDGTSDATGKYTVVYTGSIDNIEFTLLDQDICTKYYDGYLSRTPVVNQYNEVNIQVDPIDGELDLKLQNMSGTSDKVYVGVDCDGVGEIGFYCCGNSTEQKVTSGQMLTPTYGVSGDRYVKIYWGLTPYTKWNSEHIDSVYCPRGAVTDFVLKF
jgi:hypothetical protein